MQWFVAPVMFSIKVMKKLTEKVYTNQDGKGKKVTLEEMQGKVYPFLDSLFHKCLMKYWKQE